MRRSSVIAWSVISVVLLGATLFTYSKYRQLDTQYKAKAAEEEATRQRYGEALNEIATIQDSLNAIAFGDEAGLLASQSGSEVQLPPNTREQVLARISQLKAGLERTKNRIQDLDDRLKHSGVRIAGLQRMIAGLKSTVVEKEQLVSLLDHKVDSLEVRVAGLNAQVEDKEVQLTERKREIVDRDRQIATVFYTVGTKKQLLESGVVVKEGGLLGLGKTLRPSGAAAAAAFTALNTDEETVIRIPAKKAEKVEVLSPQPVSSYVLTPAGEGVVELRIVDPKEFRKIKQVVILTT